MFRKKEKKEKFILESEPHRYTISSDEIKRIAEHINNGIEDGLEIEEATKLLEWLVENARCDIEKIIGKSLNDYSCKGFCGFAKLSTIFPVKDCNIHATSNDTNRFPNSTFKHSFGTVLLPIKENGKVVNKWFLIDPTYRQFFEKEVCSKKNQIPAPGYFMCADSKTIKFSKRLLKQGYIELTLENLKMYAQGFVFASGNMIENIDINELKESVLNNQEEIDCSREEAINFGCNPNIPYVKYVNNKLKK